MKFTQNEGAEQAALFEWALYQRGKYPELELMYHIPNEGKRSQRTGAEMKRQGLKAGVPDVCLPVPRGGYHGLYIEMKDGRNKTTPNQEYWLEALRKQGYYTAVCYGFEKAKDTIVNYLEVRV